MSLIVCRDAAFGYEGQTVVRDLNFTVERGDYLCIVGENGSGKSTLVKGLIGLKAPERGIVELGDGLRPGDIGYLPQQCQAQRDFPASVYEVVLSGRLAARGIRPFYARADYAEAMRHMERLGIADLKRRCYRELSGGQQQRALLARALCATRRLVLLDEPVSGLDPLASQDLYRLIDSIRRETGIAVVMITHDVRCAVDAATHILHLERAQRFFGSAQDYRQTALGSAYLGRELHDEHAG